MTPRQQAVLVGSAVTGLLTTSYLGFINSCCCLGVVLGGVVAVQQYSTVVPSVDGGTGALIGALSGAGGSVLGFVFNLILRPVGMDYQSISREASQEMLNQLMQDMQRQEVPPEMMELLQGEPSGMFSLVGFAFLGFRILLFAIVGAVGGAIGAAIFGGDRGASANGEVPDASRDNHTEGPTP